MIAKREDPIAVPRGHELQRFGVGVSEAGVLDVRVEVANVNKSCAVPVGAGGQRAGHLFLADLGADRDDLPLLDVCSKADYQVGEALKGLLVKAAE